MSRGTRHEVGASAAQRGSGDLPGEGAAERDPEWISVRRLEWMDSIDRGLAGLRKGTDVHGEAPGFLEPPNHVSRGVRIGRNEEGSLADRVERIHPEDVRDRRHGWIDWDLRQVDVDAEAGGLRHLPHRIAHPAFGRIVHGPHSIGPEADGGRRERVVDGAHRLEQGPRAPSRVRSETTLYELWERVREDRRRFEGGGLRDEQAISGPRHVRGDPAISGGAWEEGGPAEHRIRAAFVAARVARDDCGAVLLAFAIHDAE